MVHNFSYHKAYNKHRNSSCFLLKAKKLYRNSPVVRCMTIVCLNLLTVTNHEALATHLHIESWYEKLVTINLALSKPFCLSKQVYVGVSKHKCR